MIAPIVLNVAGMRVTVEEIPSYTIDIDTFALLIDDLFLIQIALRNAFSFFTEEERAILKTRLDRVDKLIDKLALRRSNKDA